MSFGAIKLLTKDELDYFNSIYSFDLLENFIQVKVKDFNRITSHPINQNFSIRMTTSRRLTITTDSINMWIQHFKDKTKYTLIDVQNAINALRLSYQNLRYEDVISQLKVINK